MRAVVVHPPAAGGPKVGPWPDPEPAAGEVLVRLRYAALNRNDVWIAETADALGGPAVIGSDGAGVVEAVGEGADPSLVGREVVILPSLAWGPSERAPGPSFSVLGYPVQGTHAELVVVPEANVFARPLRLTEVEAAALALAGVTAWRALVSRGDLEPGERVLVTGASSGVGTYLVQIASALGAEVLATTSTDERLAQVLALGAAGGVVRRGPWAERLAAEHGEVDLVVDTAGADWPQLVGLLRRGGRLVALGRTAAAEAAVDVGELFTRSVDIRGTLMGSPADFAALLEHVAGAGWRPVVDRVVPLEAAADAYRAVAQMRHVGKVVLAMAP